MRNPVGNRYPFLCFLIPDICTTHIGTCINKSFFGRIVNDTTYTIYNNLELETWVKVKTMSNNRRSEIINIVRNNIDKRDSATTNFVLSTSERELRRTNNELIYLLTISLLFIGILALYGWHTYKKNIAIKKELEQIREQNNLLPQPVAMAMRQVEQEFYGSEYYRVLLGRIERGETLKEEEFEELEQQLKPVYPNFASRLRHVCHISTHEFRVCLLLKIGISPSQQHPQPPVPQGIREKGEFKRVGQFHCHAITGIKNFY